MSASIRSREWATLPFADPAEDLRRLRKVEIEVAASIADVRIRSLRTHGLASERSRRDAALFSHGMSTKLGMKVLYSSVENDDFDFITATETPEGWVFTPVQLKELVPADNNETVSLERLFGGLRKYVDSLDLVVALYVNRRMRLEFSQIPQPQLPVAEVWLFGAASEDQSTWLLYGDVMRQPSFHSYAYPA